MVIITTLGFGNSLNTSYINKTAYIILSQFMSLHPAEKTILEDEIDFVLSKDDVYPNNHIHSNDTVIMTADTRGKYSYMRCHSKIGSRTRIPLSSHLHHTALTQCSISRFNSYPVDMGIFEDANPVDIIVRTNRKQVTCVSYGTPLRIIMETHWRGPWTNEDKTRLQFVQDPVYFIEIQADGDASRETCVQWLTTLIPNWIIVNR